MATTADDYIVPQTRNTVVFRCNHGTFYSDTECKPIIRHYWMLVMLLVCIVTMSVIGLTMPSIIHSRECPKIVIPGFLFMIVWWIVTMRLHASLVPWQQFEAFMAEASASASISGTRIPANLFTVANPLEAEAINIVPLGVFSTEVVESLILYSGRVRATESDAIMARTLRNAMDRYPWMASECNVETAFPFKWYTATAEYRNPYNLMYIGSWLNALPFVTIMFTLHTSILKLFATMTPIEVYTCAMLPNGWHAFDVAALMSASTALFSAALALVSTYRNHWLYCCWRWRRQRMSTYEGILALHAGHAMAYEQ